MSVVIIGGGHGGASAAFELRRGGYRLPVTLIGEEDVLPYQRPPLSKGWLKGEASLDSLTLRPASWYADNDVTIHLAARAQSIDRVSRQVRLADGAVVPYAQLVIATGARARQLSIAGATLRNVVMLRTLADADRLKALLRPGSKVAIIGGGYVGLETAASSRALGADVVVVEREQRILARVACGKLSEFFTAVHEANGVRFELGTDVSEFVGDAQVRGIRLADGRVIECDVAIVGIGAIPNDELARACDLPCADGVVVDHQARTADPDIFAIGDVTRRPSQRYDRQIRLESVPNATEQARQAAAAICGAPSPPAELPWFWSDQYDLKLQIAGMAFDCDEIVIRGDMTARSFSIFHLRGAQIEAVEAVNAPADFMVGRMLIARRAAIVRDKLADPAVPVRDVAV